MVGIKIMYFIYQFASAVAGPSVVLYRKLFLWAGGWWSLACLRVPTIETGKGSGPGALAPLMDGGEGERVQWVLSVAYCQGSHALVPSWNQRPPKVALKAKPRQTNIRLLGHRTARSSWAWGWSEGQASAGPGLSPVHEVERDMPWHPISEGAEVWHVPKSSEDEPKAKWACSWEDTWKALRNDFREIHSCAEEQPLQGSRSR